MSAELVHIIAGEAGTCGLMAMVAVAYVYSRNDRMNGYSEYVSNSARWVAMFWRYLPDVSGGRRFLFSADDMRLPAVQRIITLEGRAPPVVFNCRNGLQLYAW